MRRFKIVRNANEKLDLTQVSMSFIPSLRCNLSCSFCMYNAGPEQNMHLDLDATKSFINTVNWSQICGCGLYGGEPSIEMNLYQQFYDILPNYIPKFIITNGSWSKDIDKTVNFLKWCNNNKFQIIVSNTIEHRTNQNTKIIKILQNRSIIIVKDEDEEMHAMGRNFKGAFDCTKKCIWHKQPIRLGIFPTGHVLLQNCDGAYPIVGHIETDSFTDIFNISVKTRLKSCNYNYKNINNLLLK